MKRTLALLTAAIALGALSGCNRNCDDCDDRAECPCQRCDHSAIVSAESVPAPAPMIVETPKPPPVATKPVETKPPIVVVKEPAKPIARAAEYRQAPTPQPHTRKLRSGEAEIGDL